MSDPTKPGKPTTPTVGEEMKQAEQHMQSMLDIRQITVDALKEEKKIMKEINELLGQGYEAQKANYDILRTEIQNYAKEYKKSMQEMNLSAEEAAAKMQEKFKDAFKGNEAIFEEMSKIALQNLSPEELAEEFEKFQGELMAAEKAGETFNVGMGKMAGAIGFTANATDTLSGRMIVGAASLLKMRGAARNEAFKAMAKSFMQTTSALNIAINLFNVFVKQATAAFDASNKLARSFGTRGLRGELVASSGELTKMGIGFEQQADIITTLKNEITGLTSQYGDQVTEIKLLTGGLKTMGIEATDTAASFTLFTKGLKLNATEAMSLNVAIASSAKNFGITQKKMASDFKELSGTLAAHGKKMFQVFEGIQKHMVRTGISSKNLLDIASKFDTFSTAADTAAQMNALFGTSLSAMGMHTMDEGQRLDEIQRQFQATGMSVDSLNKYQLQALAKTMGKSVPEAIQFMGGTLTEQQKEQMALEETSQQLNKTMMQLAQSTLPLLEGLKNTIAAAMQQEGAMNAVLGVMESLANITVFAARHFTLLSNILIGIAAVKIFGVLQQVAIGIGLIGKASLSTNAKLGLIGLIFFTLFTLFHTARSPVFYLLFGVIALGIFAIGQAAQMSQAGLYALAAVALAVGLAFTGIFYGLSLVIDSFTNMVVKTAEFAGVIPVLVLAVYGLAGGLLALGGAGAMSMTGMAMAAVGLFAILAAFKLTGTNVSEFIKGGGEEIMQIGKGIEAFGTGMGKLLSVAAKVKSAMGDSLMAASMEGGKMSVIVGKEAGVATLFSNDTLKIKVDMPKISMPTPEFRIYIDGKEIDKRIEARGTREFVG